MEGMELCQLDCALDCELDCALDAVCSNSIFGQKTPLGMNFLFGWMGKSKKGL
jgi:hypothetical protein